MGPGVIVRVKACRDNGRDSIMSLKQAFKAIDTNGDGTITFEEMSKHVKESGGIKEDVMMIMSSFDTNTDFRISYEEFIGNGLNQVEYDQEAEEHHQQFLCEPCLRMNLRAYPSGAKNGILR